MHNPDPNNNQTIACNEAYFDSLLHVHCISADLRQVLIVVMKNKASQLLYMAIAQAPFSADLLERRWPRYRIVRMHIEVLLELRTPCKFF